MVLALPAALRFGEGICWEETVLPGDWELWFSATTAPAPDPGGQRRDHHVDQRPAAAAAARWFLLGAVADDVVRAPATRGSAGRRAPGTALGWP